MPLTFDDYMAGKRKPVTFNDFMARKADTGVSEPQVGIPETPTVTQEQPSRLSERFPFLTPTPNPEERILTQLLNLGKGAGQLVTELPQFFVKDLPEALAATITRSGEPGVGTMVKEMTKDTAKVIAATALRQLNPEEYERWKQTPEGREVVKMIYEEPLRPIMAPLIFSGAARGAAKKFKKAPIPRLKAKPKGEPLKPILEEVLDFKKPGVESSALEAAKVFERELGRTEQLAKSPREAELLKRRLAAGESRIPTERVPIVEEILGVEKAEVAIPKAPTVAYHGTSSKHAVSIKSKGFLPPGEHKMPTATVQPDYISLTADKKVASNFADAVSNFTPGSKPEVLSVNLSKLRLASDPKGKWGGFDNLNDYINQLKQKGYDGLRLEQTGESEIIVWNHKKLAVDKPLAPSPRGVELDAKVRAIQDIINAQIEAAKTKAPAPRGVKVEVAETELPKGWKIEVQPNWRRKPGWKSEVDWKDKRIVFESDKLTKDPAILNHEIAHVLVEDKIGYIKNIPDSPFLREYAEIVKESNIHPNFVRERLAMDYGDYLTNPAKTTAQLRALFEKHFKQPKPSERGAALNIPREIARPAGAEPVKYKEAIKTPDRPEMTSMESYYKSISTQKKLTPDQAVEAGIALRQTPTGKVKPAVREAGTFVPSEFSTYEAFKDAKPGVGGGTKDWIRYVQEIDGALSLQKKAKLPGQAGPAEKYILRRQEDISKIEFDWQAEQSLRIKEITKGLNKKQERLVTQVLEETSRPGSYVKTADFATNARIKKITTDTKIVKAAQESRKALEHWFAQQNRLRGLRNQPLINYREYYAPHILRETSLWERAFGGQVKAKEVMRGPQLPDYIKPNKPFNPRELAREIGLKDYMREMRIGKILEDYANTASRDIHHTSIIQNNKAFIQQLETMGYKNAAEGLSSFTAESFGGIKARLDRAFDFPVKVQKGMRYWRGSLMRSVFPFNIAWNTFVQTLSSGLTVMRTGVTGSTRGLVDWFTNPAMRNRIKGSYSYRVKSQRGGRITRQDINTGVTEMVQGRRSAWQASIDGANYATELVERHLTGWSIASGLRHGAKRGLKGKALWDYASDIGAKTQSMYNLENKPGILRSETVQTAAPFQTFIFEMYNTAKEFAGKTGTPPGAMTERIGWVLRFTAAAYAGNEISHAVTGRRPWEVYSFIPFSDQLVKPVVDALRGKPYDAISGRGLPSFVGAGIQFARAVRSYLRTGNTRKLRNWGLKYGTAFMKIPGGTQIARMVDGWIAVANEGMKDARGKTLFKIRDPWEKARAVALGPWRTKAGIEYWEKRETGILEDILGKPKKKKKSRSILRKLSAF